MKRARIAIASIGAPVAVGLAIGLTAMNGAAATTRDATANIAITTPAAANVAAATTAAASQFVVLGCDLKGLVKPSQYVLACGDGNAGLRGLHWTSWTPQLASGYGTYYVNDCKPYCAAGHFHYYPALAVFWGSGTVARHPSERRYAQVTLVFTGKRPPSYQLVNGKSVTAYPPTGTWPLQP